MLRVLSWVKIYVWLALAAGWLPIFAARAVMVLITSKCWSQRVPIVGNLYSAQPMRDTSQVAENCRLANSNSSS
jgi:hypothetical protein